jgi:hypothetical protein
MTAFSLGARKRGSSVQPIRMCREPHVHVNVTVGASTLFQTKATLKKYAAGRVCTKQRRSYGSRPAGPAHTSLFVGR